MRGQTARYAVLAYTILFLSLTIWPGALLINRVTPLILGLPFNLFCMAVLIMGALVLLTLLYLAEKREQGED